MCILINYRASLIRESEFGFFKRLEESFYFIIGVEVYSHRAFAGICTLQADVVFKILAYDFKNFEIFLRKVLLHLLRLFLRFGKLP